jgi:hypothetical protein
MYFCKQMVSKVQEVNITEVKLNPNNPRLIKDERFKKLVKSITEFPKMLSLRPIVVNDDMMVLGGNMRLKACKEAGMTSVPIVMASELTEEEQKRFIIVDNVGYGEHDWDVLANEWDIDQLQDWGLEIPDFVNAKEAVEDDYEIPPLDEIKTDIVLGDLFEIGEHRLMCGDAKDSDAVAKLMNGKLADLVVTDPPYNTGMKESRNAKARLSQMFEDSFTDAEWEELKTASFNNYNLFTKGECALYVFIDWRRVAEFKEALEMIADVKNVIVWDKQVHGLGSDYKSTYENIVVGKKGRPQINNRLGLDYQDIWRVQRKMGRDEDHATKKPRDILNLCEWDGSNFTGRACSKTVKYILPGGQFGIAEGVVVMALDDIKNHGL